MNKHQKEIEKWFDQQDWDYWDPLVILARLQEETGEFARLINHFYGEKKKKSDEKKQKLKDELGDILFTLACFANSHDIDLDKAMQKSIDKVKGRDKDRY